MAARSPAARCLTRALQLSIGKLFTTKTGREKVLYPGLALLTSYGITLALIIEGIIR